MLLVGDWEFGCWVGLLFYRWLSDLVSAYGSGIVESGGGYGTAVGSRLWGLVFGDVGMLTSGLGLGLRNIRTVVKG